ncbi:MAG TPA: hypothetical protein ENJ97_01770 [Planctomycetes bacterium]|nr:hypothetical protein [Planctomycetota bacterium]
MKTPEKNGRIRKALVPAAGGGTRMRPLSLAVPKPFLPLGRLPLVEFAFFEARAAGMEEVGLVVSPGMVEPARRYLEGRDPSWIPVKILVQEEPKGLADAILRGLPWLEGEGAAVLNPDSLFTSPEPPLARMVAAAGGRAQAVLPLIRVESSWAGRVAAAGRVRVARRGGEVLPIAEVLPKERGKTFAHVPEKWKCGGRYLLGPSHLEEMRDRRLGGGEHDDTPYLAEWARRGDLLGVPVGGRPLDCGIPEGYLETWRTLLGPERPSWWPG